MVGTAQTRLCPPYDFDSHFSAPLPRRDSRRERRLQQIAAGRGFPVQHLAGRKHAGQAAEHEIVVEFIEGDSARGRDRARNRRDAVESIGHGVD